MAPLTYLNFDLTFESSADGYAVRVTDSPAGQASAPFVFPFSELELENFLLRLGQRSSGTRRADSPEMELAKQFGGRLFDALFDDDVRAALRSSIRASQEQAAGLRIRLRFGNTPELADIPWEYLYDRGANGFLTLSRETPLVRYLELNRPEKPLAVGAPLRILVMISDPTDYDRLDVEAEWRRLTTALADLRRQKLVEITRLGKATLPELQRVLRNNQFHIFHYIGHGVFDEGADDGFLVLEDENGRGRKVSGQDVGRMFAGHHSLQLAVLNSCEGGRAGRNDIFAGAAQSLFQQGLPAVIAMQFSISDDAAAVFAQEFYLALAGGYSVDAALAEGRLAVFAKKTNAEWGIPVLFMRAADGQIFVPVHPHLPSPNETAMRLIAFTIFLIIAGIVVFLAFPGGLIPLSGQPTPTPITEGGKQPTSLPSSTLIVTPTFTLTSTPIPTFTSSSTPIPTFTPSPTPTSTSTFVPIPTPTFTSFPTPVSPLATASINKPIINVQPVWFRDTLSGFVTFEWQLNGWALQEGEAFEVVFWKSEAWKDGFGINSAGTSNRIQVHLDALDDQQNELQPGQVYRWGIVLVDIPYIKESRRLLYVGQKFTFQRSQ